VSAIKSVDSFSSHIIYFKLQTRGEYFMSLDLILTSVHYMNMMIDGIMRCCQEVGEFTLHEEGPEFVH